MRKKYIWELSGWPYLTWDSKELSPLLGSVRNKQGKLAGKISLIGEELKHKTLLDTLVSETMDSSQIEGKTLDKEDILIYIGQLLPKTRHTEIDSGNISMGTALVTLDTYKNFDAPITEERLFFWKYSLEGITGFQALPHTWQQEQPILVSMERQAAERKMEQFKIPTPTDICAEMRSFLTWLNTKHSTDPVLKAAVAYLRFLLIRPFECDNGRIARLIANIFLSRADNTAERFYSISTQISDNIQNYHEILKITLTGSLDITEWIRWFLYCTEKALEDSERSLTKVIDKSRFFERFRLVSFNGRQLNMLNLLWDGFDKKLTTSVWASINNCSPDTALRDIQDLIVKNVLRRENTGGRSTCYSLAE